VIPSTFEKETQRLVIRFYNSADFDLWKRTQEGIPQPRNQWDLEPDSNFKGTRKVFDDMLRQNKQDRKDDRYYFIAINRRTGEPVGHAIIFDIRRRVFQSGSVGYGIYNHYWGQGFGRELLECILQVAFKDIKLHRIEAAIEIKNKRSQRLAKSVGMVREGVRREFVFMEGEWKSLVIYSVLSEDIGIPFRKLLT
jgi:[ribosomal protein S5]-alanine N-acetyltransferase